MGNNGSSSLPVRRDDPLFQQVCGAKPEDCQCLRYVFDLSLNGYQRELCSPNGLTREDLKELADNRGVSVYDFSATNEVQVKTRIFFVCGGVYVPQANTPPQPRPGKEYLHHCASQSQWVTTAHH